MRSRFGIFLILGCGSFIRADFKSPSIYIDQGACPGECCRYGDWTATQSTVLVDHPGGKKVIGKVNAHEKVRAVTGEVHVHPIQMKAPQDDPAHAVHAGDPLLITTYRGEGSWRVELKDGRVIEMPLENAPKPNSEWWIQIETTKGTTGWTREDNHFKGQSDGCNE